MVDENDLVNEGNDLLVEEWRRMERELVDGIDKVLEKGEACSTTLNIMKELLGAGEVKARKKTIEEWFDEQENKN